MQRIKLVAIGAVEGAVILALIHWVGAWAAWLTIAVIWWLHTRTAESAIERATWAIALASLVVVATINGNIIGQAIVVAGYALWQFGKQYYPKSTQFQVAQAGWLEFMALMATFGAEAVWRWPVALILIMVYAASLAIALDFFTDGGRAVRALAATWGLIVTEASLVFSIWLVNYVLPHGVLLIPQPAVVITAIGYCFGSIYLAHAGSKLSKGRLAEYAIIGLCLVVIVIAGTRWSGAI